MADNDQLLTDRVNSSLHIQILSSLHWTVYFIVLFRNIVENVLFKFNLSSNARILLWFYIFLLFYAYKFLFSSHSSQNDSKDFKGLVRDASRSCEISKWRSFGSQGLSRKIPKEGVRQFLQGSTHVKKQKNWEGGKITGCWWGPTISCTCLIHVSSSLSSLHPTIFNTYIKQVTAILFLLFQV